MRPSLTLLSLFSFVDQFLRRYDSFGFGPPCTLLQSDAACLREGGSRIVDDVGGAEWFCEEEYGAGFSEQVEEDSEGVVGR